MIDLTKINRVGEFLECGHPHLGRVQSLSWMKTALGTLSGTSRKATAIHDYGSGKPKTVALHVDPNNFMVTIAKSFILMTLKDDSARNPVILKQWKLVGQSKGEGVTGFSGTVDTYIDSDGLTWEHRFDRELDEDELVGFGSDRKESLIITLQIFR